MVEKKDVKATVKAAAEAAKPAEAKTDPSETGNLFRFRQK